MASIKEVCALLDDSLHLNGRSKTFDADTVLIGSLPEFDSLAIVSLIENIQKTFNIQIADDDIELDTFETVGNLTDFINFKSTARV